MRAKKAQQRALTMRKDQKQGQTFVRQTDIVSNMKIEDRKRHDEALQKIKMGQIVEGAMILESIKFQRAAITALESHGYIDEAAQMLVRLGAIGRAAILYERNGYLEKAAIQYLKNSDFDKTANIYLNLAKKDFHYYKKAQEAYEQGKNIKGILACLEKLNNHEGFIQLSIDHNEYELLFMYLINPFPINLVFNKLDYQKKLKLISSIEQTPRGFMIAATWLNFLEDLSDKLMILNYVRINKELCQHFWLTFPSSDRQRHLEIFKFAKDPQIINDHAIVLENIDFQNEAKHIKSFIEPDPVLTLN